MAAVPEHLLIIRLKILTGRPEREVAGRIEHKPGSDKHSFSVVDFILRPATG
jgi:hypothetical protein